MKKILRVMAVVVVGAAAFLWFACKFGLSDTKNVTVCIRVMEIVSPNKVEYSISTDGGTYVLDRAKYNKVLNNTTYTITYSGWKLPLLGIYPELEEIKPVEPADRAGLQECESRRPKE